jgi:hypothetical protein
VNIFVQSLIHNFGQDSQILKGMWPVSAIRTEKLRAIAAGEAALADLVVVSFHHADSLPDEVKNWIELWLGWKGKCSGALVALFDPLQEGDSAVLKASLEETAKKGNMEFLVEFEKTPDRL